MDSNKTIEVKDLIFKNSHSTFLFSAVKKDSDDYLLSVGILHSLTKYQEQVNLETLKQQNESFVCFRNIENLINVIKIKLEKQDTNEIEIITFETHCEIKLQLELAFIIQDFIIKLSKQKQNGDPETLETLSKLIRENFEIKNEVNSLKQEK